MRKSLELGCFLGISLVIASCSGADDLIRDPTVERWCDSQPCEWRTEGTVSRVGSWHQYDYAVKLVSDDASVWQENATIDSNRARCFEFAMVAKVESGTRVFLELDFMADGSNELSQRLPTSDWERLTFRITTPDWYRGVRFALRKEGPGLAILAELSAESAPGKCTAPPVELVDRPDGARCTQDAECRQGQCESGVCSGCSDDADCTEADHVCGLIRVDGVERHACMEAGSSPFGVACDRDSQCESDHCEGRACSECSGEVCDDGRACSPARRTDSNTRYWPRLCDPGTRARSAGELCTGGTDCASGACVLQLVSQLECRGEPCEPVLSIGECR